jgi:hypothetical protein
LPNKFNEAYIELSTVSDHFGFINQELIEEFLIYENIFNFLEGSTILVYWEEGFNQWFEGIIENLNVAKDTITIYYPNSDETEKNASLSEMIGKRWIKTKVFSNLKNDDKSEKSTVYCRSDKSDTDFNLTRSACLDSNKSIKESYPKKTRKFKKSSSNVGYTTPIHNQQRTLGNTKLSCNANDQFRNLVRENLEKSLNMAFWELQQKCTDFTVNWSPTTVAKDLEYAIWLACDSHVSRDYRDKYRLLIFNLNDKENKEFLISIFKGELLPSQIVYFSETELMSSAKRAELEDIQRKASRARVIDIEHAARMNTTAAELYGEEMRKLRNGSINKIQFVAENIILTNNDLCELEQISTKNTLESNNVISNDIVNKEPSAKFVTKSFEDNFDLIEQKTKLETNYDNFSNVIN